MPQNALKRLIKLALEIFKTLNNLIPEYMGSGFPELENRVKKPSYAVWRDKTDLSQIETS